MIHAGMRAVRHVGTVSQPKTCMADYPESKTLTGT